MVRVVSHLPSTSARVQIQAYGWALPNQENTHVELTHVFSSRAHQLLAQTETQGFQDVEKARDVEVGQGVEDLSLEDKWALVLGVGILFLVALKENQRTSMTQMVNQPLASFGEK